MKNHVWRPLIVVIGIVLIILAARAVYVPKDFGAYERGYMYSWHKKSDEEYWKSIKIKYQGKEYCKDCHEKNYTSINKSPHRIINCENCHGPAGTPQGTIHPENPSRLTIDKSRQQCYRCHVYLAYPTSGRSNIKGFADPEQHNPGMECVTCHNPHDPKIGGA